MNFFALFLIIMVDLLSQNTLLHKSQTVLIASSPNISFLQSLRCSSVSCDGGGSVVMAPLPAISENDTRMTASCKGDF